MSRSWALCIAAGHFPNLQSIVHTLKEDVILGRFGALSQRVYLGVCVIVFSQRTGACLWQSQSCRWFAGSARYIDIIIISEFGSNNVRTVCLPIIGKPLD